MTDGSQHGSQEGREGATLPARVSRAASHLGSPYYVSRKILGAFPVSAQQPVWWVP